MDAENHLEFNARDKILWAKKHKSLCFFPWDTIELRLDENQNLRTSCCCNLLVNKLSPLDKDGSFDFLKTQINQGVVPTACEDCRREETNNGISERVRNILGKNNFQLDTFASTRNISEQEIRISFGNKCSLACRSCDSLSSSTYAKITNNKSLIDCKDIISTEYFEKIKKIFLSKKNNGTKTFLHLMGGEPLVADGLEPLLDWLIAEKLNKNIGIRITTSLAVIPSKSILIKLDHFFEVQWVLSIDSVGKNYHYVRWPAQFNKIESSLKEIINHKKNENCPLYRLILSPVFSLNNIWYVNDYLDYWFNWFEENEPMFFIHTNLLHRTNFLDIQALPFEYRTILKNLLIECLNHAIFKKFEAETIHPYYFLQSTITELDNIPYDYALWYKFLSFTAEFDKRTKTKFEEYNNKLYNILTTLDQELYKKKYNLANINQILIT